MPTADVMPEVRTSAEHNISEQPPIISKTIIIFKNDIKTRQIADIKLQPAHWAIVLVVLREWRLADGGKNIHKNKRTKRWLRQLRRAEKHRRAVVVEVVIVHIIETEDKKNPWAETKMDNIGH